jgi:hypothetical protein
LNRRLDRPQSPFGHFWKRGKLTMIILKLMLTDAQQKLLRGVLHSPVLGHTQSALFPKARDDVPHRK